jgi:hypothetical protein
MPCGWSQDGLYTFNALAREISKDRKEHRDKFKKAFKMTIQQQTLNSASNKNGKRKRNCIDTYNELNENDFIVNNEEESDNNSNNEWVTKMNSTLRHDCSILTSRERLKNLIKSKFFCTKCSLN